MTPPPVTLSGSGFEGLVLMEGPILIDSVITSWTLSQVKIG